MDGNTFQSTAKSTPISRSLQKSEEKEKLLHIITEGDL